VQVAADDVKRIEKRTTTPRPDTDGKGAG
jgi:hypothetical protein